MAVKVQLLESGSMFTLGDLTFCHQLVKLGSLHAHYTHSVILAHVRTEHRMKCIQCCLALAIGQM